MRELHTKASLEIELQEKRRKKQMAVTEASYSGENVQANSSVGTIEKGVDMPRSMHSPHSPAENQEYARQSLASGTLSADPLARSSAGGPTESPQLLGTHTPQHASQAQIAQAALQGSASDAGAVRLSALDRVDDLPKVVSNDEAWRLEDLIKSDFRMRPTDPDFEITHEQLTKCVKVLLNKVNLISEKNTYERGEMTTMVNERIDQVEALTKSSLLEVNTFLHEVHHDFEAFLEKHKKEHASLNMRVLKTTEDTASAIKEIKANKDYTDQFATVLTCLAEFNSIEQALASQDEDDRRHM